MHKGMYGDGPARMSRTPGGKATHGCHCHGKTGERGMGSQYSGGKNGSNTLSWKNPKVTRGNHGAKPYPVKTAGNRWQKSTHNPSGASYVAGPDPYPEKR